MNINKKMKCQQVSEIYCKAYMDYEKLYYQTREPSQEISKCRIRASSRIVIIKSREMIFINVDLMALLRFLYFLV